MTPQNSLVIAGDGSDPTLLYNSNRKGWVIGFGALLHNTPETIEELKNQGAKYYVTTKFEASSDFGRYLLENYQILKQTNQYVIFSL